MARILFADIPDRELPAFSFFPFSHADDDYANFHCDSLFNTLDDRHENNDSRTNRHRDAKRANSVDL